MKTIEWVVTGSGLSDSLSFCLGVLETERERTAARRRKEPVPRLYQVFPAARGVCFQTWAKGRDGLWVMGLRPEQFREASPQECTVDGARGDRRVVVTRAVAVDLVGWAKPIPLVRVALLSNERDWGELWVRREASGAEWRKFAGMYGGYPKTAERMWEAAAEEGESDVVCAVVDARDVARAVRQVSVIDKRVQLSVSVDGGVLHIDAQNNDLERGSVDVMATSWGGSNCVTVKAGAVIGIMRAARDFVLKGELVAVYIGGKASSHADGVPGVLGVEAIGPHVSGRVALAGIRRERIEPFGVDEQPAAGV